MREHVPRFLSAFVTQLRRTHTHSHKRTRLQLLFRTMCVHGCVLVLFLFRFILMPLHLHYTTISIEMKKKTKFIRSWKMCHTLTHTHRHLLCQFNSNKPFVFHCGRLGMMSQVIQTKDPFIYPSIYVLLEHHHVNLGGSLFEYMAFVWIWVCFRASDEVRL